MKISKDDLNKFFDEYEALCRKYGLMLYSDGEEVWAGSMEDEYWHVKRRTYEKIRDGLTDIELE